MSNTDIITMLDPLTYGVDGFLDGAAHFGLGTDFFILSALTLVLLAIGTYLFSKIQI